MKQLQIKNKTASVLIKVSSTLWAKLTFTQNANSSSGTQSGDFFLQSLFQLQSLLSIFL